MAEDTGRRVMRGSRSRAGSGRARLPLTGGQESASVPASGPGEVVLAAPAHRSRGGGPDGPGPRGRASAASTRLRTARRARSTWAGVSGHGPSASMVSGLAGAGLSALSAV